MDSATQSAIIAAANAAGVDPNLALAVANQESGGNQNAISSAGAIGIFQLMPATAAGLGVNPNDASQNIQGGIAYLSQMLNEFGGNISQALAAYNWGPGAVSNAISNYGSNWLSYAPAETQSYVASILGVIGTSAIGIPTPAAVLGFFEAVPAWGWAAAGGAALLLLLL
jgi:soluble lytic murein transglycosylase-like protein